jgi:ABC-type uncharacterized transport system involved in gliding motility auxiliary subunit
LSARARATREAWITGLLLLALVGGVLALARTARLRFDLTEEGLYTLDPATRTLLDRLEDRLQVKLYFNRDLAGAEALLPTRLRIEDFMQEIAAAGGALVQIETVDPTTDLVAQRDAEHVGIQPFQIETGDIGEAGVVLAYQGLELRYQDRSEIIPFTVPAELEFAFTTRLSSLLRPRRPEIAFFSREPSLGPPIPGIPRRIPAERIYHELRASWTSRATVRDVDLSDPAWLGEDTAALVVARPERMNEAEVRALDRYLAEGGRVLLLADAESVDLNEFLPQPLVSGLDPWLSGLGIRVSSGLVWDESCLPIQVGFDVLETQAGREQVPVQAPYGFFPRMTGAGLAREHVVTASLGEVYGLWMHPVEVANVPAAVRTETLLQSSDLSWVLPPDTPIVRDQKVLQGVAQFARQRGPGRPVPVAVSLQGAFPAQFEHDGLAPAPGLLVVIGDSDLFHNGVLSIEQLGSANTAFAANLGDWLSGDESLIGLRTRGRTDRALLSFREQYLAAQGGWATTDEENRVLAREATAHARARQRWIAWGNVLGPAVLVALVASASRWRRRARSSAVPPEPVSRGVST